MRDNLHGAAAVNIFQRQVRGTYISNMKEKDRHHFDTAETTRGPLEGIFRRLDFKPLVFGTFGEMSSNVKEVVNMAVEYGVEHAPQPDDGGHDSGRSQDNFEEALQNAAVAGSMARLRQLDHGQGQICGNKTHGSQQSSCPGGYAGEG